MNVVGGFIASKDTAPTRIVQATMYPFAPLMLLLSSTCEVQSPNTKVASMPPTVDRADIFPPTDWRTVTPLRILYLVGCVVPSTVPLQANVASPPSTTV